MKNKALLGFVFFSWISLSLAMIVSYHRIKAENDHLQQVIDRQTIASSGFIKHDIIGLAKFVCDKTVESLACEKVDGDTYRMTVFFTDGSGFEFSYDIEGFILEKKWSK